MEIRLEFNVLGIIYHRHTMVDKEIHISGLPFSFSCSLLETVHLFVPVVERQLMEERFSSNRC